VTLLKNLHGNPKIFIRPMVRIILDRNAKFCETDMKKQGKIFGNTFEYWACGG
jgi:hypothetical protein